MSQQVKTHYGFNDQWMKLHHQCLIRIQLWYINYFNCPNQAFKLPKYVYGTNSKTLLFVGSVLPGYGDDLTISCHLFFMNPSFIFGGWKANNEDALGECQQPLHCDVCPIKVNGVEYSVATNPHLLGNAKPSTIILPLGVGDYRCLNFRGVDSLENVKIDYGTAGVFQAWVSHGGETHDMNLEQQPYSGHPCLHINVMSRYHMTDLQKFEFDVPGMLLYQQSQVRFLESKEQKLAVQQIQQDVFNVHRACSGSRAMDAERKQLIKKMKEI